MRHDFEPGPILARLCGLCSLPESAEQHRPAEPLGHECRPSAITGRCVLCGMNPICGSAVPCAHSPEAYGES